METDFSVPAGCPSTINEMCSGEFTSPDGDPAGRGRLYIKLSHYDEMKRFSAFAGRVSLVELKERRCASEPGRPGGRRKVCHMSSPTTRRYVKVAGYLLLGGLVWIAGGSRGLRAQQGGSQQRVPGGSLQSPAMSKSAPDPSGLVSSLASIKVQSSLVVTPVTVTDRHGNLIEDLSENDFHVLDNGVPQQITQFQLSLQPVAVVIVVQDNASVGPLLDQVQPVGPEFSGLLVGEKGVAAVLAFSDKVRVVQNFTNNPTLVKDAIASFHVEGSKARLNDALARAILMLSERPTAERRIVIVFSEGFDHGSETNRAEIIDAAANANVAIYGLRFDPTEVLAKRKDAPVNPTAEYNAMALPGVPGQPQTPSSTEEYNNPSYLSPLDLGAKTITAARAARPKARSLVWQYAQATGGREFSHWTEGGLQNQIQRMALEINSQYILAYMPSTLNQTGFHRIQVQLSDSALRVRARTGYFYGVTTKAETKTATKVTKVKKK
jgi:VWFA-related protein